MDVQEAKKLARSALARLSEELKRGQSDTLRQYLAAMGRFHRYSLRNAMLIALQKPEAQHVAGFWTWRRLGRAVRKGERGIAILAPVVRRPRRDRQESDAGGTEADVNLLSDDHDVVVRFRGTYVFDVSQTDGKPLPEFARTTGDPGAHLEKLRAYVAGRAIEMSFSQDIAPARGMSADGRIVLLPNMDPAEEFSVLVHEYAHERLHGRAERLKGNKTVRETEAEAVAYAVCTAIGLQTNTASADYIRLWDGDHKTLAASLTRVHGVTTELIGAMTRNRKSLAKPVVPANTAQAA